MIVPNHGINMAGWPKRECRSIDEPNRLILSQEVEDEYREAIFRPKFDRFASVDRRRRILDIVVFAAEKVEPSEAVRECRDPKDNNYPWPEVQTSLAAETCATCFRCIRARHSDPVSSAWPRSYFRRSLSQRPRFNRIRHQPRIGGCGRKFPQHHCERVSACRSIPRTLPFGWRGPRRNSVTSLSEMNGAGVITSIKTGNPGLAWYVRKSGRSGSPVETEAT